jgi:hypothetical protein
VNNGHPDYVISYPFTQGHEGHSGFLTPEQGAKVPLAFATLPADGPNGGFFGENGVISW